MATGTVNINRDSAAGKRLGQLMPAGTGTNTLYTVPKRYRTQLTLLVISCNANASYSIFHDEAGTSYTNSTNLRNLVALTAGNFHEMTFGNGAWVRNPGTIGVQSSVANAFTFTLYGLEDFLT